MNKDFIKDYEKKNKKKYNTISGWLRLFKYHDLKYLYYFRKSKKSFLKPYYKYRCLKYGKKYGIEIHNNAKIGSPVELTHAYNITINGKAVIGDNVVIFKGVTIGSIRSGKKAGVPTIGDNVVLCTNCFLCGNIHIGNNVLIAANSFVNFNVPDNSIVIGNPGTIHKNNNHIKDYIAKEQLKVKGEK